MPNTSLTTNKTEGDATASTRRENAGLSLKLNHNQSQNVEAPATGEEVSQATADEALMSGLALLTQTLQKRGLSISLNGIKGTGKTTLCRQLKIVCATAGVPVQNLHVYRWYSNLFFMPCVVLYNRFVRKELLILDRTIIDNLAVWFVYLPRMFLAPAANLVHLLPTWRFLHNGVRDPTQNDWQFWLQIIGS